MSAAMRPPPAEVPTLTEVVGFGAVPQVDALQSVDDTDRPSGVTALHAVSVGASGTAAERSRAGLSTGDEADAFGGLELGIDEAQLAHRVLLDVQRQVDRMFEFRVRETIGPAFAKLLEAFLRDTHEELNRTLHDVVRRAVAQELSKHRSR